MHDLNSICLLMLHMVLDVQLNATPMEIIHNDYHVFMFDNNPQVCCFTCKAKILFVINAIAIIATKVPLCLRLRLILFE